MRLDGSEYAIVADRRFVAAFAAVHLGLIGATGDHIQHAFDTLQAGRDEGAIAIIETAATAGAICAGSPALFEVTRGIAPVEKFVEAYCIGGDIHHPTQ